MNKALLSVAGIVSAVVLFASSTFAAAAGQIEGGDIYRVRNVTTSGEFTDPTSGTCGNTFQFKVRVHNPGPDALTNVNVKATLSGETAKSHSSQVTITASNANPSTTTDTAGVNLDKAAKLNYISGSTELLDANGAKLQTLGNTILTSGVNIGTVGVSTQQKRFVQFSVKADCPTTEVKNIKVCELATKTIVTINEKDFDANKHSKNLADCAEEPTPGEITVCELETGKVVNISEDDFDAKRYSKDLSDCAETPVVPSELPKTGMSTGVLAGLGLSMLAAIGAYALQRRNALG
jgi:LPXTG-motif cell wall-anchored protein/uncharacterized repeat protein (TIGR01451 family)